MVWRWVIGLEKVHTYWNGLRLDIWFIYDTARTAPPPLFCAPRSEYPHVGFWQYDYWCHNPWNNPPETCDVYEGQKAGRMNNDEPVPSRGGRTDVEGVSPLPIRMHFILPGLIWLFNVGSFNWLVLLVGTRSNTNYWIMVSRYVSRSWWLIFKCIWRPSF